MKILVYGIQKFERSTIEAANTGGFELKMVEANLSTETASLAAGCDTVCAFVNDDASAPVLERLAQHGVRFLALRSAGYNHVDLEHARKLGIKVANVPEYSPYAVAEHTVALMLALNRKLARAHNRVRDLNFSLDGLIGFDMHQKTVGVIGLGRIGEVVCQIMCGFGCRVLGYDIDPKAELCKRLNVEQTDLDELVRGADIVTLHAPLNKKTHYLVDDRLIRIMKPGVMLINTSRGGLVDTKAVIRHLKSGHIGYLGLDVYEEEAGLFFRDHSEDILQDDVIARLMTFQNVLITSHQAFLTNEALENIASTTFENISAWAQGERAPCEL